MKTEEVEPKRANTSTAGSISWLRPLIVLVGIVVTVIGAFYFLQAGVSRITATGISSGRHGTRMFAWAIGVAGYWIITMLYLQTKKNEN